MKNLKLSELAHYAEIAAAIGVVVSLLYVGRQVQDNTSSIRSATVQAVADASDTALRNTAIDEELSRIRLTGNKDVSALTELEEYRFYMYNRGQWIRMQNIFAQRQIGVLEESFWGTYAKIICDISAAPGVRATWQDHAVVLDTDFVEFVESCTE